ncbi:MAG: NAD(P)/FAD-dependent oxidoreductase, partial [Clostridia bacterium]|nr:NAD(P)/FAD-dependent oxidoreductase [Clostridia bacterium]
IRLVTDEGFDIGRLCKLLPKRSIENLLGGLLPKRIGQAVLRAANVAPMTRAAESLSADEIDALNRVLKDWRMDVLGIEDFERAQVTAGGALLKEFDIGTLESTIVSNLYAVGEVLDVDGDCGGFNLQWAWGSAFIAADAIIRKNNA